MRNTLKVAKWEIKRNIKNKSFLISLFITPLIFILFMVVPSLFSNDKEATPTKVMVNDQLYIYTELEAIVDQSEFNWVLEPSDMKESDVENELKESEDMAYLFIDERALNEGVVPVYMSDEIDSLFINQVQLLATPIQAVQMEQLGLSTDELAIITKGITFIEPATEETSSKESSGGMTAKELERMVPGAFAGFIMLSIVFTGMAIFQSASDEKKNKIAEIILSSLTPSELMQGKIIGYFALGIIQTFVSIVLVLPVLSWKIDIPFIEYLFVPELVILILIALLGYLLFAALFVGVGATMSDISTAGNFQGLIMMLPFAPFIFIGPVFSDPSGLMAQIGTYIPFTTPGVLILRLSLLEEWPWVEIIIALAILAISAWLFMKLAGKIFKVGILMYGKNASLKEIVKWLRA
ncbi:ABC transporter permease [Anaerobacillus isosaccharinicus]|uniref:ABC transporter permease n=1 Tax=Anaerobacillus isosaccharinicus TaxID=1532552 RepID=A0A1S2LIL2_9BACI|nr:ABC transporter permease [Anaerobacillus isosaccharinicus]MBA5588324.1 ABC transporter permease [Anaerobacillus isosaccharinicus]QOY38584.1 ABC transporter permease [Anaerobacillus isosaccharinicus]